MARNCARASMGFSIQNGQGGVANGRFMVQAGSNWYLSQDSSTTTLDINGGAANWYVFDPAATSLFGDASNLGSTVIGSSLGDITATGVYMQTDSPFASGANIVSLGTLQVSVITEAGTYALLFGFAGLAMVALRRR